MSSLLDWLQQRYRRIDRAVKAAFYGALGSGFVAHLPYMVNRFVNHDSVQYMLINPSDTVSLSQGKWLSLSTTLFMQGNIYSTGIMVPVMLLLLACTAALTVAMLKVRSPLWAGGIGCMVTLFPAVMSANTYFAGPTFFSALFLAALSAYLADRFRYGFLIAIVPLTMACGIYSVFIGYAAGLIVMRCIWLLLENERPLKSVFVFGFKGIFLLAASAALYYVILQVALRQAGVALSNYRGIDRLGGQSLATLPATIAAAYRKVYYFFRYGIFLYYDNSTIEACFRYLNWATLALCGALSVAVGFKKLWRGGANWQLLWRMLTIAVLVALFPMAIHAIAVLGSNADTHWIMCYPFVLVYVYMLMAADRLETVCAPLETQSAKLKWKALSVRCGTVAVLLVTLLLSRRWFFTTNQSYEFLRAADQHAYTAGVLLLDDMRETEGYRADTPVVPVGDGAPAAFQYNTGDFRQVRADDGSGYSGLRLPVIDNAHLRVWMRDYIGVELNYADSALSARMTALPAVQEMPIYPAEGAIRMIDGCLVIKLS